MISYSPGLPKKSGIDKLSIVVFVNDNSLISLSCTSSFGGSKTIHEDKSCTVNGVGVGVGSPAINSAGVGVADTEFNVS